MFGDRIAAHAGRRRRFELVIGTDGLHSALRVMVFGAARAVHPAPRAGAGLLTRRTVTGMTTVIRATRVLLILLLALLVTSFVVALATSGTGWLEKLVLLLLIAGCVYAAAKVSTMSAWVVQRLRH